MGMRLILLLLCLSPAASALAAPPAVTLTEVASGLASPVEVVNARDASNRLFIVEQAGKIKVRKDGVVLATPFLDLTAAGLISCCGERGLLGLAFHPQYRANGAFYIYYTAATTGALTIARVLRGANPDVADASSLVPILSIPHPVNANHNGGRLAFGPDGHLYAGTGDGGSGGDPDRNGQNTGNLLGKLLRIAVDGGTGYTIPASNPFPGSTCARGQCPEIFHYGLRNPWKFSFDRQGGDLYIGDVGQGAWEEVDFLPAGTAGGKNFGWGVFEGDACFNDNYFGAAGACAGLANHTRPILTYDHGGAGGISITGGYVYRGHKSAPLRGYYIYADYGSKRIWAARQSSPGVWQNDVLVPPQATISSISSFAEDEAGELYVVDLGNGKLWRIDGPGPAFSVVNDWNRDGREDIILRNSRSGAAFAWYMNDTRLLQDDALFGTPLNWTIAAAGDFNGDGNPDLVIREANTGAAYIWLFNGSAFVGDVPLFNVDPSWEIVATGDVNGDGNIDLIMRNRDTGVAFAWLMSGTAIVGSQFLFAIDPEWEIVAAGDVNGDGQLDIVYRSKTNGAAFVWFLNRGAFVSEAPFFNVDPIWELAQMGDFDGDGRLDIVLRHKGNGTAFVWYYNVTTFLRDAYLFNIDTAWEMKPLQ